MTGKWKSLEVGKLEITLVSSDFFVTKPFDMNQFINFNAPGYLWTTSSAAYMAQTQQNALLQAKTAMLQAAVRQTAFLGSKNKFKL